MTHMLSVTALLLFGRVLRQVSILRYRIACVVRFILENHA